MLYRELNIAGWTCDVFISIDGYWQEDICDCLRYLDAPEKVVARVRGRMRKDEFNTGFTYSNPHMRRSVMVIGRSSSGKEFLNSFVHEMRHLTDDIARVNNLSLCGEPVAYLSGDMVMALADVVTHMCCDHCRKRAHH